METILIIDDLAIIRKSVASKLADEGYTCLTARNGAEGLALLQEHACDLVLLDIIMPGDTGIDVTLLQLTPDPMRVPSG